MQTKTKIMFAAVFFSSMAVGTAAPVKAQYYRNHHHLHYWPGHYHRPYADIPGLTGLIHY